MHAIVETVQGRIRGEERPGHVAFRGIRYAAPPTGGRRFRRPAAAEPHAGLRDATQFGAACPQPPSVLPGMMPGPLDEDCLFLNVYAPDGGAARKPVLVWLHGGGFTSGSGAQSIYDGGRLAVRGDAIVVTVNYRLGPFGFLHLPLAGADPGDGACNVGLLDQVAALEWVRDNAAAFGGDPGNVTIFGESAGGMSVATLLGLPAAQGLFHRAIAQSGAVQATQDEELAARVARQVLEELSLAPRDAARLREVPANELVEAASRAATALQDEAFLVLAPAVDGVVLPRHPADAIAGGAAADVPLLTGTTRDEWRLFTFAMPRHRQLDEASLEKRITRRLERLGRADAAREMIAVYRARRPEAPPWEIFDAIQSDRLFRVPALQLADAHRAHQPRTYVYSFAWASPAGRGVLGACHAIELPFVFGTLDVPQMDRFAGSGPAAEALSGRVMDAWLAFARAGDPGHAGLPPWPPYDASRPTLVLDAESRCARDPDAAERAAWDGILAFGPAPAGRAA